MGLMWVTRRFPVTHLRKMMLEELQRRNLSKLTAECYLRAVEDLARFYQRPPDQLGPEQIRHYQAHLFTDRKLDANTVSQHLSARPRRLSPPGRAFSLSVPHPRRTETRCCRSCCPGCRCCDKPSARCRPCCSTNRRAGAGGPSLFRQSPLPESLKATRRLRPV